MYSTSNSLEIYCFFMCSFLWNKFFSCLHRNPSRKIGTLQMVSFWASGLLSHSCFSRPMESNTSNTSSKAATLSNTTGLKKPTAIQYLRPGYLLFHERAPPSLCSCLIWSGIGLTSSFWCRFVVFGFCFVSLLKVTCTDFLLWNVLCCS